MTSTTLKSHSLKIRAYCARALALCMAGLMSLGLSAKTTTWTGTGTGADQGKFSASSNWNAGAPEPGDTVVVNGVTTWVSETFSIGEAGLTFVLQKTVTSSVKFTGAGAIRIAGGKSSDGTLKQEVACDHAGGTYVTGGVLGFGSCGQFGSGTIVIGQESDTVYGMIKAIDNGKSLLNDIEIDGECLNGGPIWSGNNSYFMGNITATGNFKMTSGWASLQTLGEIVASGKTIVLDTKTNKIVLNGPVSASLEKTGAGTATVGPTVEAPCGGEDETISILEGTLEIGAKGFWTGKSITIDGDTAVFSLLRNNCISKTATLTVKNEGKVNLGASAAVAELWVDGVKMDAGVYSAANLPAVFSGTGQMVVGNVKTWCGGSSGLFSESTNWSGGSAPEAGDTLLFDKAVTLSEETFDVGADGITIVCNANVTCTVAFSGEGCVIKKGSKNLSVVAVPTLVGGFRIEDGVLDNGNKNAVTNPLGAVPIEITGTGKFQYNNYYKSLGNAITIHDIRQPQAIVLNGPGNLSSKITADCDFTVFVAWQGSGLTGSISAPGKTVTIDCESGNDRKITISGEVDASLTKSNSGTCTFSGTTVGDTNVLTVAGGTLTIAASKVWSGNEVRVAGAGSVLALSSRDNLTKESLVYVSDGGVLNLSADVKVSGLNVNGIQKGRNQYTARNLPEVICGSGILTVGELGLILVFR